jgi:hypothetical protein
MKTLADSNFYSVKPYRRRRKETQTRFNEACVATEGARLKSNPGARNRGVVVGKRGGQPQSKTLARNRTLLLEVPRNLWVHVTARASWTAAVLCHFARRDQIPDTVRCHVLGSAPAWNLE